MTLPTLRELDAEAQRRDLLLRLQVGRPLGWLWSLRIGVAQRRTDEPAPAPGPSQERPAPAGETARRERLVLLGDLKGWALPTGDGLCVDSLQVAGRDLGEADLGVGALTTAACFAWALEATPCRRARFLAIRDDERQHRRLVRYFRRLGFSPLRELGAAPWDLPARMVWGGSGLLMQGECRAVLGRCARRLGL